MVKVNGRHECPACKKSYANRQHLSRHKKDCSRNSNVSYSCSKCTKVFSRKDSFNRHFPGCKGKEVSKVCSKCSVAFPTLWRLNRHIEQAHSTKDLKCNKCDKIYQRRPAYEQHMKICTGVKINMVQEVFTCNACGKTYQKEYAYNNHVQLCSDNFGINGYQDDILDEEVTIICLIF